MMKRLDKSLLVDFSIGSDILQNLKVYLVAEVCKVLLKISKTGRNSDFNMKLF